MFINIPINEAKSPEFLGFLAVHKENGREGNDLFLPQAGGKQIALACVCGRLEGGRFRVNPTTPMLWDYS